VTPTRLALEAALAADPDDPARHAAYADLLIEEGDPRGEFVRLQLALEDPDLPADRREAMQRAADELLRRHEAEWLGPLAPYVVGDQFPGEPHVELDWHRGWPYSALVDPTSYILDAITQTDRMRLLRRCRVVDPNCSREWAQHIELLFQVLVNTAVAFLYVERYAIADRGVDSLIATGLITPLNELHLVGCEITDDGALALAACPDVRRLKSLTLDGNLISPIGVAALAEVGVTVGPQVWDAGRGDAYV
jgi:uncharacterized protein (TIGR02996 family)